MFLPCSTVEIHTTNSEIAATPFPKASKGSVSFPITAVSVLFRDLALVGLILFFLCRNGEPVSEIGWSWSAPSREVLVGLLLFFPLLVGTVLIDSALKAAGLSSPSTSLPAFLTPKGNMELALAFFLVLVVAVSEETIFRGYLILRLRHITSSTATGLVISSSTFSLGHGYEGAAGAVTVGIMGLALALVYVWRKGLIAPITMHFLQDFTGIILLPLLRSS